MGMGGICFMRLMLDKVVFYEWLSQAMTLALARMELTMIHFEGFELIVFFFCFFLVLISSRAGAVIKFLKKEGGFFE